MLGSSVGWRPTVYAVNASPKHIPLYCMKPATGTGTGSVAGGLRLPEFRLNPPWMSRKYPPGEKGLAGGRCATCGERMRSMLKFVTRLWSMLTIQVLQKFPGSFSRGL